jgi:uncharacterized protein YjbJ (UPF0337 family)
LQCAQKLPETGSFYRPSGILSFALQTGPPHAKTSVVMSHQEAEGQPGTLAETVLADSCFKTQRRKPMKPSTNDQIEGQLHELTGNVKEKAGKATDNPKLTADGQDEKLAGKVQNKVGQIEKVLEK